MGTTAVLEAPEAAARPAPDPAKLDALVGRMLGDLGGAYMLPLVRIGDGLGLYAALAEGGPATPAELARRTGANERLLREWLCAHAAAGYLDHDAASGRFALSPEQAMVFAVPDSAAGGGGARPRPFARARGAFATWIGRARDRRALAAMDDRALRDLGRSRGDLSAEIARWRA